MLRVLILEDVGRRGPRCEVTVWYSATKMRVGIISTGENGMPSLLQGIHLGPSNAENDGLPPIGCS